MNKDDLPVGQWCPDKLIPSYIGMRYQRDAQLEFIKEVREKLSGRTDARFLPLIEKAKQLILKAEEAPEG